MSSILENLLQPIGDSIVGWYVGQLDLSDPFKALMFIFFSYIVVKGTLLIFPFLNPLADFLTWPFRLIHLHAHITVAREIEEQIKREQMKQKHMRDPSNRDERQIEFGIYNRFEIDTRAEGSNVYCTCTTLDDMIRVAMAPWKHTLSFFIMYLALLPLIEIGGMIGFLMHIYVSLVLFHALMPSTSDQMMIIYTMLKQGLVPKFCVNWLYVVFFSVIVEVTLRTKGDLFAALIAALVYSLFYLSFLLVTIRYFRRSTEFKYPVLLKIPDSREEQHQSSFKKSRFFPSFYNEME